LQSQNAIRAEGVGEIGCLPVVEKQAFLEGKNVRNRRCLRSEATNGWYWIKVKQNQPEIWEEAKKLF